MEIGESKILQHLETNNHRPLFCSVAKPTCPAMHKSQPQRIVLRSERKIPKQWKRELKLNELVHVSCVNILSNRLFELLQEYFLC